MDPSDRLHEAAKQIRIANEDSNVYVGKERLGAYFGDEIPPTLENIADRLEDYQQTDHEHTGGNE